MKRLSREEGSGFVEYVKGLDRACEELRESEIERSSEMEKKLELDGIRGSWDEEVRRAEVLCEEAERNVIWLRVKEKVIAKGGVCVSGCDEESLFVMYESMLDRIERLEKVLEEVMVM